LAGGQIHERTERAEMCFSYDRNSMSRGNGKMTSLVQEVAPSATGFESPVLPLDTSPTWHCWFFLQLDPFLIFSSSSLAQSFRSS